MEDNIKCKLLAYERCSKTTITFTEDNWDERRYNEWMNSFKNNKNIYKIVKVMEGSEEILFEKIEKGGSENV